MSSVFEQIVHSLQSGVIAVDADGVIIVANPNARSHLGMASSANLPRLDALPAATALVRVFDQVRETGAAANRLELFLDLPDGGQREIGLAASPMDGPDPFNGVIFLFTDMTERRRLERAAEINRQLAALGELTAGVVHELRNPVSIISGMAELLMRKLDEDDSRRDSATTIFREASQLERSIAQFLGFARPFDIEVGFVNPTKVCDRSMQLSQRWADEKGVSVTCLPEADLPDLNADGERLAQAIVNIVNNAIDATPEGGEVSMRAFRDDDHVVFEVRDGGPGIQLRPDEDLFAPFFTKKEGGTGLGLTIVNRIVSSHKGVVSYANVPEGGACFTVRIPIVRGALT